MSGHSKWATIKHKKGAADKARGKLFAKLIRQVEVAARAGGSDLESNATLRTMYQKARDNSVPLDTIERAIKRGSGELEGIIYEPITYEGYAPHGVALLIEVLSDNRNRIGSEVRSVMKKSGGSVAEPGAVAWQFDRKGVIIVPGSVDEDEVMMAALDAGAEDIVDEGDTWRVTSPPSDVNAVREALEGAGIAVESADVTMLPQNTIELDSAEAAKAVLRVIDALEELDDVQDVYANFDIPDELMQSLDVTVALGSVAPGFTLMGVDGRGGGPARPFSLADYAGGVVVLVFYPADGSPVCTVQLSTYTNDIGRFEGLGAHVLAISPQSVDAHERFARANGGFAFPMLADVDRVVGAAYGIIGPIGFYRRAVFVIDASGIVRYAHRSTAGLTFRPTDELVAAIGAIAEKA